MKKEILILNRLGLAGRRVLKKVLPHPAGSWIRSKEKALKRYHFFELAGGFGALQAVRPLGRDWGYNRGKPIDRYYIEKFIASAARDIRGHVLEFEDNLYTIQFGGSKVTKSDVLHSAEGNPFATIVGDLTDQRTLSSSTFDCVICTQVLLLIYDVRKAVENLYRILKPGGAVLVTVPGVAHKIAVEEAADCWRFTDASLKRLFSEVFPEAAIQVKSYGNVLAAIASLHQLSVEYLLPEEMDYFDPEYEVSISLRAVKPYEQKEFYSLPGAK